jgi:heat shock protein HslJ/uncharacterized membrane protein/uncharacterized lipoprotein YbaY
MRMAKSIGGLLGLALVLFCAALAPRALAAAPLTVEGTATILARIALPPETDLVVEATAPGVAAVLAESRIGLAGRQPPAAFSLTIAPDRLAGHGAVAIRAAFVMRDGARFVSDPVTVASDAGTKALGELVLKPYKPLAFATALLCGDRPARFGMDGDTPVLDLDGTVHPLRQEAAASGARYTGEGGLEFWSHGGEATLTLADGTKLACREADDIGAGAASAGTLTARGNEPFWLLTIGPKTLEITGPSPELVFPPTAFVRDEADGRPRFTAQADGRTLIATIDEKLCTDSMSGLPFPVGVRIALDGRTLDGCGGETMTAIEGGWRVVSMEGAMLPGGVVVTMEFGADGRLAGKGGCNRYTGPYTLTGEGLSFGNLAATRMACIGPASETEARFFALLGKVTRVTPGEAGRLRLMAGEREVLVLDRAL